MGEEIYITKSSKETQKLGKEFVTRLHLIRRCNLSLRSHLANLQGETLQKKAVVVALYGDLGSGKTTFAQGMAKGLSITKRLISPTFIIVRSYKIKNQKSKIKNTNKKSKMFYHIDLYRVQSENDLESLGIKEILIDPQNIVAIEWAEKLGKLLPKERVDVEFKYVNNNERRITIKKFEI